MVNIPAARLLKKTESPSPSSYRMPLAHQLGVGIHAHLHVGVLSGLSLQGLVHAINITFESIFANALLCAEYIVSLSSCPPPLLQPCHHSPSLTKIPEPLGEWYPI